MKIIRNKDKKTDKNVDFSDIDGCLNGWQHNDIDGCLNNRQDNDIDIPDQSEVWKVLVVDDEPDVHEITRIILKEFRFDGRNLELINASSGAEAREIFNKETDIAVAMIDVVMETEDAGLELVKYIRNELKLKNIRLIIRTGQPGSTPERQGC